jgi:hypothetical protein
MPDDLVARYRDYASRFAKEAGEAEPGRFATFRGHLIKMLTAEEFEASLREYRRLVDRYQRAFERGDTIDNVVVRELRDHAARLLEISPI